MSENLNDLTTLVAVAREQSFTAAARKLGSSQSAVSQAIRNLEERLGLRLFNRTTRSVTTTDAGELLLASVAPALEEIEAGLARLGDLKDRPTGNLRITADEYAVSHVLWPKVKAFMHQYPEISVELSVDYGLVDIARERFDAGVRRGGLIAQDMVATPIGPPTQMTVVATPDFLDTHGRPEQPKDLPAYDCINLRIPAQGGFFGWLFMDGREEIKINPSGRLVFNSISQVFAASEAGFGLAYLPEGMVTDAVAAGRLERVLDAYAIRFPGYHLYYTSRRQLSPAFSLLVEALRYRR